MLTSSTSFNSACLSCKALIRTTGVAALPWRNTRSPDLIFFTASDAELKLGMIRKILWRKDSRKMQDRQDLYQEAG